MGEGVVRFRVNSGFEEQLCLYEALSCQVDTSDPLYKQYRLTKITEKYPGKRARTQVHFLYFLHSYCALCVELQLVPREVFAADPAKSNSSEASYRCRKCR